MNINEKQKKDRYNNNPDQQKFRAKESILQSREDESVRQQTKNQEESGAAPRERQINPDEESTQKPRTQ